jgi:transcriptional regulator
MHACDRRKCCNPEHLRAGSHGENMEDMKVKGRANPVRGEDKKNAKLTETQVLEIRNSTIAQRHLAKIYGVSPCQISKIRGIEVNKMTKKKTLKSVEKTLPMKRIRVGKLATVQDVAKLMARLVKRAVKGGGEVVNDSYKLVMCCSMLAKTLEVSDLESRVEALELKAKE